eukprot:TRINITY_DN1458_c0_g1_i1.p1 TRINITY_DN1458_c0_g1~~TRINITY_DN1458_c0_g1_i1.p1  ORF type:complete len:198 (-),score=14.40 TRINITY_DN1458_c0_g1_i1:130-672(-)
MSAENQDKTFSVCTLTKQGFHFGLVLWQCMVINEFATSMPSSIWNGNHVPMTETCASIFFALQRCLMVNVFTMVFECSLLVPALCPTIGCLCSPCILLGACAVCVGAVFQLVVCIWGIIIVVGSTASETADCDSLYTCAWWVFVGSILVNLAFSCCQCCCFKKKLEDHKGESAPLIEKSP